MRNYAKRPQISSHVLDSNPKAANQVSLIELLQRSSEKPSYETASPGAAYGSAIQLKSKEENMSDLLKTFFEVDDVPEGYVVQALELLKKIQEIDLSFLSATVYEMMDNETHDLPSGEKEPEKKVLELKLAYIRELARSGKNQGVYHQQLQDQTEILESLQKDEKYAVNPNVLLSPQADKISGYMTVLGPSIASTYKDLVEDEKGGVKPVADKLQIGFDSPVRSFSWYTLYLLKEGKKEDLPSTAPIIRTFQLPREQFIALSKQQIEESELKGKPADKTTAGVKDKVVVKPTTASVSVPTTESVPAPRPNAEDIKLPNQMGFPSQALPQYQPQNLVSYFSEGDYGKDLIRSSHTGTMDEFKEKIGFGQYERNKAGDVKFIPSPIHFFDRTHTAFHQEKGEEEDRKWQAYSYIEAVRELIIRLTFFKYILKYLDNGKWEDNPMLKIPKEIRGRVPKEILDSIAMPKSIPDMFKDMLEANNLTLADYQYQREKRPDRRGNLKSSLDVEDQLAGHLVATLSKNIFRFKSLDELRKKAANVKLTELKRNCQRSSSLKEAKAWALQLISRMPATDLTEESIKGASDLNDIKRKVGQIALEPKPKDFEKPFLDVALQNDFFLVRELIIKYLEDKIKEPSRDENPSPSQKMLDFFKKYDTLLDFLGHKETFGYLKLILSSEIRNDAVRDTAVELKFHTLNFFFRLLRIMEKSNLLGTNPSGVVPPAFKIERKEHNWPYMRLNPEIRKLPAGRSVLHMPFDRKRSNVVYTRPEQFTDKTIYENTQTPFMGGLSGTTRDITGPLIETFSKDEKGEKDYWEFQLYNAAFMIANRFHSFLEAIYPAALWGSNYFASDVPEGISVKIRNHLQRLSSGPPEEHREILKAIVELTGLNGDFLDGPFSDISRDENQLGLDVAYTSGPTEDALKTVPGPSSDSAKTSGVSGTVTTSGVKTSSLRQTYLTDTSRQLNVHHTVADGNCGIHALMGVLKADENQYKLEDTQSVRNRLFEYMDQQRETLIPRYTSSIADLLSEITSKLRNGEALSPTESSHFDHFKKHVPALEEQLETFETDNRQHFETIATLQSELVGEIVTLLRQGGAGSAPVISYLIESIGVTSDSKYRETREQLSEKESQEEKNTVIRQSPLLGDMINEDLNRVLAKLGDTILQKKEAYTAARAVPEASMLDLVNADKNDLYDGYRDIVKENGYFLRQEDMLTLADMEEVALSIYIADDQQHGRVVNAVSHGAERADVRRIFHRGVHYEHAELVEENTLAGVSPLAASGKTALPPSGDPMDQWEDKEVGEGLIVYHGTDMDSALSIQKEGIRTVKTGYGSDGSGGELGPGFYVTSNEEMAGFYAEQKKVEGKEGVIVSFKVKKAVAGKMVPQNMSWEVSEIPPGTGFVGIGDDFNFVDPKDVLEFLEIKKIR